MERFDELAHFLAAIPSDVDVPADLPALPDDHTTSLPFFEAYFSNFIEGTEFSIEEAEAIVETGDVPENRPEDGHDVLGTFEAVADEGYRRLADLPPGLAHAAFGLFLVSEVHPYDDGNGRVARAAMCAELTAAEQSRIVVPIVFRNEYRTALRNLSRDGRCDLYVRTLAHAWRWTAGMPWQDRGAVDGYLAATNALTDSTDAERFGVRLELP